MRADIWQRFGGLKALRQDPIRYKSQCSALHKDLNVDGTIRNQTTIDTLNDIKAFREAAKKKVRQAIYRRAAGDDAEVACLNGLLNSLSSGLSWDGRYCQSSTKCGYNPLLRNK